MIDTISRILEEELSYAYCDNCKHDMVDDVYEGLEQLPSAEPKIIHCKDCRNRGEDKCPMRHIEWIEWEEDGYI